VQRRHYTFTRLSVVLAQCADLDYVRVEPPPPGGGDITVHLA